MFIALFLVIGTLAFQALLQQMFKAMPYSWVFYQHVIVLAIIAAVCFILACVFGSQIPACYVR